MLDIELSVCEKRTFHLRFQCTLYSAKATMSATCTVVKMAYFKVTLTQRAFYKVTTYHILRKKKIL